MKKKKSDESCRRKFEYTTRRWRWRQCSNQKDTNIATLQKSNKTIKIYSDNLHNPTIIDVQYFLSKLNDTITLIC